MTSLRFEGQLTAAEGESRTVTGVLLPYGEPGRTSAGTVTCSAGVVTLPDDPSSVVLNVGHDRERPVGRATRIEETPDGLVATFAIAETPRGDELLAEVASGLRRGLSVELDEIVIRAGKLLAGLLTDVGAVVRPAFPSALVAADAGEILQEDQGGSAVTVELGVTYAATIDGADPVPFSLNEVAPAEIAPEEVVEASAPKAPALVAARAPLGARPAPRGPQTPQDAFKLMAAAFNGDPSQLTAALSDIVYGVGSGTGLGNVIGQPQWLGELFANSPYRQKFANLVAQGKLTGLKAQGFRWTTKPTISVYSGDKAAIPSAGIGGEAVSVTATRFAVGADFDRAFIDFGMTEVIERWFQFVVEDYLRKTDAMALTAILAAGADSLVEVAAVPVGAPQVLGSIIGGAIAVDDIASPSFALVNPADYAALLLTKSTDALAYLGNTFGLRDGALDGFKVVPATGVAAGDAVVGAKDAIKLFQLDGTPLRVSAEHIANGGRDEAAFGYAATLVENSAAVVLATPEG